MKTLNQISVAGNIGQDPDIKHLDNGTTIANFSLATSSYMGKNPDGSAKEATQWHKCSAFGNVATIIEKFVKKGDKLFVTGEMRYRDYMNKEGVKVYLSEIHVQDIMFMGGVKQDQSPKSEPMAVHVQPKSDDLFNDDLPY